MDERWDSMSREKGRVHWGRYSQSTDNGMPHISSVSVFSSPLRSVLVVCESSEFRKRREVCCRSE